MYSHTLTLTAYIEDPCNLNYVHHIHESVLYFNKHILKLRMVKSLRIKFYINKYNYEGSSVLLLRTQDIGMVTDN